MTTTTSNIIDLAEYRRKLAQTQAPDQELDQDCPLDWVPEKRTEERKTNVLNG